MSLVDKGMTNREISTAMKLPIEIITKKFNELFGKANVKNKTELVKWWKDQRKPAV
jgi:DNA-binding NarL/FixJ family response regulator